MYGWPYGDTDVSGIECVMCGDVEDENDMQHGEEIGESGMVCRFCVRAWHAQVRRDAQDGIPHPLELDEVPA